MLGVVGMGHNVKVLGVVVIGQNVKTKPNRLAIIHCNTRLISSIRLAAWDLLPRKLVAFVKLTDTSTHLTECWHYYMMDVGFYLT
jgi:hypothetical protein